jgi:hypothetical protein
MGRFEHFGELVDIDKGIAVQEQAVRITPDGHANKPICLHNLGLFFACRFAHSGGLDELTRPLLSWNVLLTPL